MIQSILYFLFVHLTLLLPSYGLLSKIGFFKKNLVIKLLISYFLSVTIFGFSGLVMYITSLDSAIIQALLVLYIVTGTYFFVSLRAYRELGQFRFPLLCLLLITMLPTLFLSLNFNKAYTYIPDPERLPNRNYEAYNVKVLNVAQTPANDNYIPYRQAQFIVNGSDAGNDCFVCEWGVHFFQRTPLLGAVTAGYYVVLDDQPPIDYLWSSTATDGDQTYAKFQIIAHILNGIFVLPAFFLLDRLFKRRTAIVSSALLVISPFFVYNAVFSWPKSLVAFFILSMWLLLLEKRTRNTVLAGVAGGLAFLTHDLAAFYVVASVLYLLLHRRYRDTIIISAVTALFALPWLVTSSVIYKKPSTFALYPFSLDGLPQPGTQKEIFEKFFDTSPFEIVSIRFDTLFYLLSPYDLIYKNADQDILRRYWATGLYSIPGSLGLGLVIPLLMGIYKRLVKLDFWILVCTPIVLSAAIVGWRGSRAIASLHFAQAVIVMLTGLAVAYLFSIKNLQLRKVLLLTVFVSQVIGLVFLVFYSYPGLDKNWFINISNAVALCGIVGICMIMSYVVLLSQKRTLPKWLRES